MKQRAVVLAITAALLVALLGALWPQPAEAAAARWRFQSIWVPSITLWKGDKYWVDLMNVMAAGDLDIKWFAGGTLVTRSDEMFDAVAKGTIEAGHRLAELLGGQKLRLRPHHIDPGLADPRGLHDLVLAGGRPRAAPRSFTPNTASSGSRIP